MEHARVLDQGLASVHSLRHPSLYAEQLIPKLRGEGDGTLVSTLGHPRASRSHLESRPYQLPLTLLDGNVYAMRKGSVDTGSPRAAFNAERTIEGNIDRLMSFSVCVSALEDAPRG